MPICGTEAPAPQPEAQILPAVSDPFLRKLARGERVIAVELDSPRDADLTGYMASARRLQQAGVDALTIADCPIARARVDASLTACKLRRELGLVAMPHMTCRDRNLNAIKALLLGLYAEGGAGGAGHHRGPHPHRRAGRGKERLPVQLPQAGAVHPRAGGAGGRPCQG